MLLAAGWLAGWLPGMNLLENRGGVFQNILLMKLFEENKENLKM